MWVLLIIKLLYVREIQGNLASSVQDLTDNFFANLNADPYLTQNEFSEKSIDFINRQTDNYIALMKQKYGIKNRGLAKRSTEEYYDMDYAMTNSNDTYLFDGLSPFKLEIIQNASDVFFLQQAANTYAVILEKDTKSSIKFYEKRNGTDFHLIFKEPVVPTEKLIAFANALEIFVILSDFKNVVIYTIVDNTLKQMQTLNLQSLSDITIWENSNGLFLGICREKRDGGYKTTSPVYKWLGKHFDLTDEITTYGAKSMSAFSIGSFDFLAIANYQHDDGHTNTYSEIFKYNVDTDKYELHQKILTNGAIDVDFFSFKRNGLQETFLVIANSLKVENHIDAGIKSIIYKYIDQYFIPFQSIANQTSRWIAITGASQEFLLVALSGDERARAFTYDGWMFVKTNFNYESYHSKTDIYYAGFQMYPDNLLIKFVNNGQLTLYRLNFFLENNFKDFHDDTLKWCQKTLAETNDFNVEQLKEIDPELEKLQGVKEYAPKSAQRSSAAFRAIDYEDSNENLAEIEDLSAQIGDLLEETNAIGTDIENYLSHSGIIHIKGDIIAENVTIKREAFFENDLEVETINGEASTVLDDFVHLDEDYDFENTALTFDNIKVEDFEATYINEEKMENLLRTSHPIHFDDVVIDGKVIFNNGLKVNGTINGVSLNSNKMMLVNGNQVFNEDLAWKNLKIHNATSKFLNKLNLEKLPGTPDFVISGIENLKVKDLVIRGYLNGQDVRDLNQHALRTVAEEQILDDYEFEDLEVNNMFVKDNLLSNRNLSDAIMIDEGDYNFGENATLLTDSLSAEKITVRDKLNDVQVDENEKLGVLLKDSEDEQVVNGTKIFEDVIVINPINIQGKINSERLKKLNPIQIIPDEEIVLKGDYNFTGKIEIEAELFSRDMKGSNSQKTLQDIVLKGLEIDNEELPYHFQFKQTLNVDRINVDTINATDPSDFVINGNDVVQDIFGIKVIQNNLHITGSTNLIRVNDIYVPDLENDVLMVDGDQQISGSLIVEELVTTSINAANSKLGDHDWQDVVTSDDQEIPATIILDSSVEIKTLKANSTEILGRINNHNFTEMLEDSADLNVTEIKAPKTFHNIQVKKLLVENGVNIQDLEERLQEFQEIFHIEEPIVLPNNFKVENLEVDGHLNGMRSEDFAKNCIENPKEQIFNGDYVFDTIVVFGKATIQSEEINGIPLKDIVENTLKANEAFYIDDVTFKEAVISLKEVTVNGAIPGLDLETVVTIVDDEQTISKLVFANDVVVVGDIEVKGLVNGTNYTNMCTFSNPRFDEPLKSLIITENAYFLKGPNLQRFLDVKVQNLEQDVWMANKATELTGFVEFETMNFENEVTVQGEIDGVDVTELANNYFSKTKNQTISSNLDFTDGIDFLKGISATEAQVTGLVSGQNIIEFVRTAILHDVEQIFQDPLQFETCHIEELSGDFLVNNLNLPMDIMRYDADNVITGLKRVPNIIVKDLTIEGGVFVQNVELLDWIYKSVRKTGGFIDGKCIFEGDVTFSSELGVVGKVNGISFNSTHVLLKEYPQTITGRKIISLISNRVTFEDVDLKGLINGVDITQLAESQVYNNENSSVLSEINLNAPVLANNINIKGRYNNHDINRLMTDLLNTQDLNNYHENYALLLNVSNSIKESVKYQAYYLDHYEVIQHFENIWNIYYLAYRGYPCLAIVDDSKDQIEILRWEESTQTFSVIFDTLTFNALNNISYLSLLNFEGDYYLYFEYPKTFDEANKFIGEISSINIPENVTQKLFTNGTRSIHPLILPDTTGRCIILTFTTDKYLNIHCESNFENWHEVHQQIEAYTSHISTITIESTMYMIIVQDEFGDQSSYISIWKMDINTKLFNGHQNLHTRTPNGVSAITYKGIGYLAISSGYLQNEEYRGLVEIHRFDPGTKRFVHWHDLLVETPRQVEFALLPSDELVLYILTDNIIEPMVIYEYEGIGGFKQKHSMKLKINEMKQFNTIDGNFVLGSNNKGTILIRSYFKGHKN